MATASTPTWSAARSGLLGDPGAVDASAQINQLLGTHGITPVYQGKQILTPNGTGGGLAGFSLNLYDKDQPFTMSGTTIGRVVLPVTPFGNGADLIVSLCADNAGIPSTTPIVQTRIPAAWLTSLAAYTATSVGDQTVFTATGSPLATPSNNAFTMGAVATFNFSGGTPTGGVGTTGPVVGGNGTNTIIVAGGLNAAGTAVTNVFTIPYAGGNTLNNMVPQPSLPVGLDAYAAMAVTTDPGNGAQYAVITGGQTGTTGSYSTVNTVYASQLNGGTGQMTAWSTQAALPQAVQTHEMAAYQNFLYVTGGVNTGGSVLNTVYWANVANGQIQSWNTGPSLPVGVYDHFTAAINGFLFVIGGFTQPGNTAPTSAVWYAPIHADGSLGKWIAGPSLQSANASTGNYFTLGSDGILFRGGLSNEGLWSLTVGPTGPCQAWQEQSFPGANFGAALASGAGQYYWFEGFTAGGTSYVSAGFIVCPYISVPLPATGMTNGATYHIVLEQPNGAASLNDYVSHVYDSSVFPGNPTQLYRQRGTTAWTTDTVAIPITVYDLSAVGKLRHLWDDNGARITTTVWGTTPNQPALGLLEATAQPGLPINSNYAFTNGSTAPWRPTGGTFAPSSAQTHSNLPYSALLTPSGSAAQSYTESELVTVLPGRTVTMTAWLYSPAGYSNVAISANWFDATGTYISTTSGASTSIPAGAWTKFQSTFTNTVTNAVSADMVVLEGGTPPATALLYVSEAAVQDAIGPQLAAVCAYQYAAVWPNPGMWPPLGFKQLA